MGRILQIICGAVLAAGLCASAPALGEQNDAAQQQQGATRPEGGSIPEPTLQSEPSPNPLEAACEKGDEKRYSDLCAQWRAADSARESAFWTAAGFWAAFFGLVVGSATVSAAVAAALFAKDAAQHTEDAANAAWASEKVARESAERQLRAYVSVSDFYMTDVVVGATPTANFTIRNGGATPAKRGRLNVAVTFVADARNHKLPSFIRRNPSTAEWGPNDEARQDLQLGSGWKVTKQDMADLVAGKRVFLIAGIIIYTDVFGATRRTVFRAVSPGEKMTNGKLRMYRNRIRSS